MQPDKHIFNLLREIPDNEYNYFDFLLLVVTYSCPDSKVRVDLVREGYNVTIFPANPEFKQKIVDNVLEMHRRLKQKIEYSKSLKISKNVSYYLVKS